ncbi:CHAT domain-containing protein [Spongiivirga sp. MCCC 1A20706]|uniref:CHAT domain-containing protein n=1 Tax=Spongiivirga sp. MCCC 1A20706 TaxID=3160963 RepID=UPI003977382D
MSKTGILFVSHWFQSSRKKFFIIIFFVFMCQMALWGQSTSLKLLDSIEFEYHRILNEGDFKATDSLVHVLQDQESNHLEHSPELYLNNLVFQVKMLALRKKMSDAQSKLDIAKSFYAKYTLKKPIIEQAFLHYTAYLKVQIARTYFDEEISGALDKIKSYTIIDPYILALSEESNGRNQINFTNYKKALEHFKNALKIYEEKNLRSHVAVVHNLIGVAYDGLENTDSVIYYNSKAIELNKSLKFPNYSGIASSTYNLGLLFQERLGNAHKAERYFLDAVENDINHAGETNEYLTEDYRALAETYLSLNDLNKAALYAKKAVLQGKKYLGVNDGRTAQALLVEAEVFRIKGDLEKALAIADEANQIIQKLVGEQHRWTVLVYLQKGRIAADQEEKDEALIFFTKAASISKKINRDLYLLQSYEELATLQENNKNYRSALYFADSLSNTLKRRFAKAKYKTWNNTLRKIRLLNHLGKFSKSKMMINNLRNDFDKYSATADLQLKLKAQEIQYLNKIEDLNWKVAHQSLEDFLTLLTINRNRFSNQNNRVFYNGKMKQYVDSAIELCSKFVNKTEDEEAKKMGFKLMEINKNTALLEGLQNVRLKKVAGVPANIIKEEQQVNESLQNTFKNIVYLNSKNQPDSIALQNLEDKLLQLNLKKDSIDSLIKGKYPLYANMKILSDQQDFSFYQKDYLAKDQALIEYYLGEEKWYQLVITRNNVLFYTFDDVKQLRNNILKLKDEIVNRKPTKDSSKKLYKQLIPKLDKSIKRLVIISDGILVNIPFEMLERKDGALYEKYAISYAGSVNLLVEQNSFKNEFNDWKGYAPQYQSNELPNNKSEVLQIKEILEGEAYIGKQATKKSFVNTAQQSGILHLAMHTKLDEVNHLSNKLLFTPDGDDNTLAAHEIYGMNLNAKLAVLSACDTGTGEFKKGEGVMSMSRAFTYAGVGSTVMTLWKVSDKESSKLMHYFYQHLKNGDTKDVALQNAKLDYIKNTQDELLRHPYYWAGFVFSGDNTPIKSKKYWIFGPILLALTGIIFLFYKKSNNDNA